MKRAIVVVLDGCGAGAAPDSASFGDTDSPSTLEHVWDAVGRVRAPTLEAVGFFAAGGIRTELPAAIPGFCCEYGRLQPVSIGKDSVTGHWEMMGAMVKDPFPTYPTGFPKDLVTRFEEAIGRRVLANRPASGTAIIQEFGDEHSSTGSPILYTSADSVFQIAAHEEVVSVNQLYAWCELARKLCVPPNHVQRVIARPFAGSSGAYYRTERRRDFPLPSPENLVDAIGDVYGIGVVPELFGGRGFRNVRRTQSNPMHARAFRRALDSDARFIFANFEDFDMKYGHRNDAKGFARSLERFDRYLGEWLSRLRETDLLILTADHGNDPTTASTDHSREFVPWVCITRGQGRVAVGDQLGLTQVGRRVAAHLGVRWPLE